MKKAIGDNMIPKVARLSAHCRSRTGMKGAVDISSVIEQRGRELGVPAAEAFVHLNRDDHASDLTRL